MDMPNLDAMTPDELVAHEAVFRALQEFARSKRTAIFLRQAGKIADARRVEDRCDVLYKSLPAWAMW